ncbi:MAG: hypothetical protein A4E62_00014 [Syntrophorhabdus sp. PtaU1.Bin002]|nr:MAG: hypothetical protein A4E62_00014 [Syntrophorhabdus sp. PtaU1.Bin002]
MQCDKDRESRGYLERVVIDGAKPFLFRSRVRTLLGLPEWDGDNRIFSSPSLPVGFKYGRGLPRDVPFAGTPYSYTRTGEGQPTGGRRSPYGVSEETDLNIFASGKTFPYESEEDGHRRTAQNNEGLEDKTVKNDIFVKGTGFSGHRLPEPFENPVIAGLTGKYEASGPAAGPAYGAIVSLETGRGQPGLNPPPRSLEIFTGNPVRETEENDPAGSTKEGPDAVSDTAMKTETITIEIPGSSRASRGGLPPLPIENMGTTKEERSGDDTSRPRLRSDFFGSPEVTTGGKDRLLTDVDGGKKGQTERGLNNTTPKELHVPDNCPVEGSGEGRFETHAAKASGAPSDQGRFFARPVSLPPEHVVSQHVLGGEEDSGFHGIGPVHAGAMDRIEQIHRALREQATRTSAEHKRRDEDPMSEQPAMEMPPLPPPSVIITRAPSPQMRVPRAFWQRRYLGHVHLRPLR